jgi:hypothetical protein
MDLICSPPGISLAATPVIAVTARDASTSGCRAWAPRLSGQTIRAKRRSPASAPLRRPTARWRQLAGNLEYDASASAVSVGGDSLPLPRRERRCSSSLRRVAGRDPANHRERSLQLDDDVELNAMEAKSRACARLVTAGATVSIHGARVGYMLTADGPSPLRDEREPACRSAGACC